MFHRSLALSTVFGLSTVRELHHVIASLSSIHLLIYLLQSISRFSIIMVTAAESRAVGVSQFGRRGWCPWSEWSRCAIVPCLNEIRFSATRLSDDLASPDSSLCLITPSARSKGVIPTAVVQSSQGGVVHTITPFRRRTRECACRLPPLTSLINFFKPGGQCLHDSEHVHCAPCSVDEVIYSRLDPDSDARPLSFCAPTGSAGFSLYSLLGGVAGGVVIILFICWLIRMLIKTFPYSNRLSERARDNYSYQRRARGPYGDRRRDPSETVSNGRTAVSVIPDSQVSRILEFSTSRPPRSEPPPAYKDVIRVPPVVDFVNTNRRSQNGLQLPSEFVRGLCKPSLLQSHLTPDRNPTCPADDRERATSSSQTPNVRSSQTPPPSYEEIISSDNLRSETHAEPSTQQISTTSDTGADEHNVSTANA
ncbi:unnamed protein product [Dicrocoelium dendriticum]|nr:unnamed protein product [Dicrocoelium dendriticum]